MNIYQLTDKQLKLLQQVESLNLDEQTALDTIEAEGFDDAITDKLEAYAIVAREFEMRGAARKTEAQRMAALATTDERKAEALRSTMKQAMERLDMKEAQTDKFSLKIKLNPPAVEIFGDVPKKYMVKPAPPPAKPSLTLIKDAIKNGANCSKFAKLTQATKLEIK